MGAVYLDLSVVTGVCGGTDSPFFPENGSQTAIAQRQSINYPPVNGRDRPPPPHTHTGILFTGMYKQSIQPRGLDPSLGCAQWHGSISLNLTDDTESLLILEIKGNMSYADLYFGYPCRKRGTGRILSQPVQFCARKNHTWTQKTLFLRWDELGSLGPRGICLKLKIPAKSP